ncbi:MAG: T9SS type A sorting domain-containing protein [Ferruginibacter sp.]|nr:T9SS type A sorting domain-containing protein [Ferruginibacter sp.]
MKKVLSLFICLISLSGLINAQTPVSAAVKPTAATPNGVTLFLRSSTLLSGKVSSVTLTLAIPVSVGARPSIIIDNSPNTSVAYTLQEPINQNIQGTMHYVYNLLGDGDQGAAAIIYTMNAGIELEIAKARFSGNVNSAQVKLVNLPFGGTDPNANSFFGFSVLGVDRVNEPSMFYTVPGVSTAQNEIIPGGYDGLSITTTTGSVVLPVKFTAFDLIKKDNDASITWAVENETSITDRYEIERSIDGTTFEKVTTLLKLNNGSNGNVYSSLDKNISKLKNNGILYYRIKQIDTNGQFVYSEIKNIRLSEKIKLITAYPNPVRDVTTIEIDSPTQQDIVMNLITTDGKMLQTITIKANKGINIKKIGMNNYSAGSYLLKVIMGNDVQTIKIIKE